LPGRFILYADLYGQEREQCDATAASEVAMGGVREGIGGRCRLGHGSILGDRAERDRKSKVASRRRRRNRRVGRGWGGEVDACERKGGIQI